MNSSRFTQKGLQITMESLASYKKNGNGGQKGFYPYVEVTQIDEYSMAVTWKRQQDEMTWTSDKVRCKQSDSSHWK